MPEKLNPRRSPATAIALLALFAALAGTAIAADSLTGKEKKQVKKISTKVFKSNIGGASVGHADSADTATKAAAAATATSADSLGGIPSASYQRRIAQACPPPQTIASVGPDGEVTCATPVRAIRMTPAAGERGIEDLGNGLRLAAACHESGGSASLFFENLGATAAGLSYLYSDAGGSHQERANLAAGDGIGPYSFNNPGPQQIDGQFIYSLPSAVMTIAIHASDDGTSCEVRGTVVTAAG
jgi:hypothetical protein